MLFLFGLLPTALKKVIKKQERQDYGKSITNLLTAVFNGKMTKQKWREGNETKRYGKMMKDIKRSDIV